MLPTRCWRGFKSGPIAIKSGSTRLYQNYCNKPPKGVGVGKIRTSGFRRVSYLGFQNPRENWGGMDHFFRVWPNN